MLFSELINAPMHAKVVDKNKGLHYFIGLSYSGTYACFSSAKKDNAVALLEADLAGWDFYVEPPIDRTVELTVLCAALQGSIATLEADKKAFKDSLDFVVADRDALLEQKATLVSEKEALAAELELEKAKVK
jgi:hypothetical protein